jgi:transposase-like protein
MNIEKSLHIVQHTFVPVPGGIPPMTQQHTVNDCVDAGQGPVLYIETTCPGCAAWTPVSQWARRRAATAYALSRYVGAACCPTLTVTLASSFTTGLENNLFAA